MQSTLAIFDTKPADAGGILAGLRLARRCFDHPEYAHGRYSTPLAFYWAVHDVRRTILDAVGVDAAVCGSEEHADAIAEELGIIGLAHRVNAIEHLRRTGGDATAIAKIVEQQLDHAIDRISAVILPADTTRSVTHDS